MAPPPKQEVAFEVDGARYVLVFDFTAIAHFEDLADLSLVDALGAMEQAQAGGRAPKISHIGYLLQAGFRRHHPDMTPDEALALAMNPAVQAQLGVAVSAAMGGDESGNARAPAKTGAKAAALTGTRSSRARSKPG
jgi:hypothetical protein